MQELVRVPPHLRHLLQLLPRLLLPEEIKRRSNLNLTTVVQDQEDEKDEHDAEEERENKTKVICSNLELNLYFVFVYSRAQWEKMYHYFLTQN